MGKSCISRKEDSKKGVWSRKWGYDPINNYVNKKIPQQNFLFPQLGESPPPLNAISKTLNFPFAQKEDFLRKLSKISITFVYLLFYIMLKCFLKNHYRSRDIRLHNFRDKLHWNFLHATKKEKFWENTLKPFWCS